MTQSTLSSLVLDTRLRFIMKGMDQSKRVKGLGYKLGRDLIHPLSPPINKSFF
jgi:hypothetical protein